MEFRAALSWRLAIRAVAGTRDPGSTFSLSQVSEGPEDAGCSGRTRRLPTSLARRARNQVASAAALLRTHPCTPSICKGTAQRDRPEQARAPRHVAQRRDTVRRNGDFDIVRAPRHGAPTSRAALI